MRVGVRFKLGVLFLASLAAVAAARADDVRTRLLADVQYLAHDELRGRMTGTPGAQAAALFLTRELRAAGGRVWEPAGSYWQAFNARAATQLIPAGARLGLAGSAKTFALGVDWTPLPWSAPGGVPASELVEITRAERGTPPNVSGRIVLLELDLRDSARPQTRGWLRSLRNALDEAVTPFAEAGARAVLIVDRNDEPGVRPLYPFHLSLERPLRIPVAQVTPATAAALRAMNAAELTLQPGLVRGPLRAYNICAHLPATVATDRMILIGAHYDHVGQATTGGDWRRRVFNGADDNASGTAVMLELARQLGARRARPFHLLFVGFGGEELGLFGSRHFVREFADELASLDLMINLDMAGRRYGKPIEVYGVDSGHSLREIVTQAATAADIAITLDKPLPGLSDFQPFRDAETPWLFPFTGLHDDYHRPVDDWERLDLAGMADMVRLVAAIVDAVSARPTAPAFTTGEAEAVGR
jgi:aminopeptidase YwaD